MQSPRDKIIQSVTLPLVKLIPIIVVSHITLSNIVDFHLKHDS